MRGYLNTRTQTHARESKENREDKKHSHRLASRGRKTLGEAARERERARAGERASERTLCPLWSLLLIRDETGAEKQNKTRRESERESGEASRAAAGSALSLILIPYYSMTNEPPGAEERRSAAYYRSLKWELI